MAELTPLFMDISGAYSGDELGLPNRDVMGEGVLAAADLAVSGGSGNSVNVAAGACWVLGDTNPARQPCYRCYNDAVVNKGISPDAAQPRRVLVVAQIVDEAFSGSGRLWRIDAIHGTPAAAPVVPATPASALPLANILVPAAAASSAAYTITDLRQRASVDALQGIRCRLHKSAAQSTANGAATGITFDVEDVDTDSMHDAVNPTRVTARTPGLYLAIGTVLFDGVSATGARAAWVRANGVAAGTPTAPGPSPGQHAAAPGGAATIMQALVLARLVVGDYLELMALQSSGGALNVFASEATLGSYTSLDVVRIGP